MFSLDLLNHILDLIDGELGADGFGLGLWLTFYRFCLLRVELGCFGLSLDLLFFVISLRHLLNFDNSLIKRDLRVVKRVVTELRLRLDLCLALRW